MIVAVTGGTGFIGAEIARRHQMAGDDVRILSRRGGTHRADLTDPSPDLLAFVAGADVLYHCAGEIADEGRMHALHVEGTNRLVAAASGRVGHWVQLSSVGAYGPQRDGVITEDTPARPLGIYETTKTLADEAVAVAASGGAFTATILRPTNVIGMAMPSRSVLQLIGAIARGIFVFIGPLGAQTNYLPVETVADAALFCVRQRQSGIFIVNEGCTFEDFAHWVSGALGRDDPKLRVPEGLARFVATTAGRLPGFPLTPSRVDALTGRAIYSAEKLRKIGFISPVGMEQAVEALVAAWRGHVAA